MEINHKRGGFMKGRLVMLCQAANPWKKAQQSTNKVIDCKQSQSVPLPTSVVYFDPRGVNYKDNNSLQHEKKPRQSANNKLFGGGTVNDEGVDAKAANYISTVRERLKRESIVQELTT